MVKQLLRLEGDEFHVRSRFQTEVCPRKADLGSKSSCPPPKRLPTIRLIRTSGPVWQPWQTGLLKSRAEKIRSIPLKPAVDWILRGPVSRKYQHSGAVFACFAKNETENP